MPRRRRRHRVLWCLVAVLTFLASFSVGLLAAPIDFAAPPPVQAALLLDRHGHLVAELRSPEQQVQVPGSKIAPVMRQAIIAAEDQRFLTNPGIDLLAIARAALSDLTGGPLEGGSTITQQYVKNVYTGSQRSFLRKIREAALAIRLEQRLPKQVILTRYLNTIYLGEGTYGVEAAAEYYFGVHAAALTLPEAAMLAGLVPAPSDYNPVASMRLAKERQFYVLNRMEVARDITAQQASAAYLAPLHVVGKETPLPTIAPEFRDLVQAQLAQQFTADQLFRSGLRVTTTLDLALQQSVVDALHQVLPAASDPEAAVVAVDPDNGDILALTTKRNGGYQPGGLDLALAAGPRNSGSSIKPFTLAVALEEGRHLSDSLYGPSQVSVPYPIHNAAGESGYFTLASALAYSVNTIYGPLASQVGTARVAALARAAGLGPYRPDWLYPSMGLGVDVYPITLPEAYATIADHGVHHPLRSVLTVRTGGSLPGGAVLEQQPRNPPGTQVIPAAIDAQVVSAMDGVVAYGTGTTAALPGLTVFGKTGTTNNFQSAWFTGCVPTLHLCLSTWMGYDTPRAMLNVEGVPQVYGGTLPAEVFVRALQEYRSKLAPPTPSPTAIPAPAGVPVPVPAPAVSPTVVASRTPRPRPSPSPTPSRHPSPSPSPKPTPLPSPPVSISPGRGSAPP
ncbi:MAG: transglycosylase domain-containing protein [Mycobacteriales bacterium]